jgi:hypothetical protein
MAWLLTFEHFGLMVTEIKDWLTIVERKISRSTAPVEPDQE